MNIRAWRYILAGYSANSEREPTGGEGRCCCSISICRLVVVVVVVAILLRSWGARQPASQPVSQHHHLASSVDREVRYVARFAISQESQKSLYIALPVAGVVARTRGTSGATGTSVVVVVQ